MLSKKILKRASLLAISAAMIPATALAEPQKEHSDTWLEAKLETTYVFNPHINPFEVDVEVKDGVANLSGAVDEAIDKDLAEEIAKSLEGITSVKNNIVVQTEATETTSKKTARKARTFSEAVSDATTTASVKSKLLWNRHTEGLDVNVSTNKGIVTLEGKVETSAKKELTEKIARNTSGVKSVDNKLTVEEKDAKLGSVNLDKAAKNASAAASSVGDDISDSWISTKVRSSLLFSSDVDTTYIDVTTNKGVVSLNGTALTSYQRSRAEEIAKDVIGVKEIDNELSVAGKTSASS